MMKKYKIEYKDCKASYTREKLESVARELGCYEVLDEGARDKEYLWCAVALFCSTHFMWAGSARMNSCDAATRGDVWCCWQYQPNGSFRGWIHGTTEE